MYKYLNSVLPVSMINNLIAGSLTSPKAIIYKLMSKITDIDLDTDIVVHNSEFYDRVFYENSLGLGETYMLGFWDTNGKTLDELFCTVCKEDLKSQLLEMSISSKISLGMTWFYNYLFPVKSIEDSKIVALQHYDLDRKIYESMLGKSMTYSCAYFKTGLETLDQAQLNKMELIKIKLGIKPGMRVLDIGCGWGSLAAYLSIDNVCVDAITISKEQYAYATEHFESDRVKFYLQDYREFKPQYQYDAIVSVGMFEHVNSNNYEIFMKTVHALLKPRGLFLLHTIGSTKSVYVPDKWIGKYIFPNSQLPSLAQITLSAEKLFVVEDVHNFGSSYDKTLMQWHNNFTTNYELLNQSMEIPLTKEFYRMWTYYLLSCAGAFRARKIQLFQVVLAKDPVVHYDRQN